MAGKLRAVVLFLVLAGSPALAQVQQVQQIDPNFQALLNALMQGTQVALLTPLPDGTLEVTSFAAPGQRTAAEAAMLIERARINLQNLGVERPSGLQLATALAGGTIIVPNGSTQISSVLTGVTLQSQIVNATALPTVIGVSPGGVSAASGASATPPNGGLARPAPAPQTQQAPIVSPLPPSNTAVPPSGTATP
jgi:hypothetical protein